MKKLFDIIEKFEAVVISAAVLLMAVLLITNVLMRIIGRSIGFAEEVCQILLLTVTFLGMPYCVIKSKHINMSILIDFSPTKVKKFLYIIISLGSAAFMLWMTKLSFDYVLKMYALGRTTVALGIPVYIYSVVVPMGFLLGGIEYLRTLIKNIKYINEEVVYLSSEIIYSADKKEPKNMGKGE